MNKSGWRNIRAEKREKKTERRVEQKSISSMEMREKQVMILLDQCRQVAGRGANRRRSVKREGEGGEDIRARGRNRRRDKSIKQGTDRGVNTIHHCCFVSTLRPTPPPPEC